MKEKNLKQYFKDHKIENILQTKYKKGLNKWQ